MQTPKSESLYEGSLFATTEAVRQDAGEKGEVLEAPDPSLFYKMGATEGQPSDETVQMHALAQLTIQMYDRLREKEPLLSDDDIRERMLPMPCGKLATVNETLFAFCTSRERIGMRDKFIDTLLVRARLEAGEITPNQAKLLLSELMGMDAQARARLKEALAAERRSN
jgi:hypothetical protein